MFDRKNWSRFVGSIFALTLVSAVAIAAVSPNYFTSIFTAEAAAAAGQIESRPFTVGTCDTAGPIEVESSGGTTAPTAYASLGAAFTAINAGTHTDTISIDVCGDASEGATTATLNASGSGSASYTAITIAPAGGAPRTISGAATAGSPMIDFSGADNVTINGLNTGGNSLTISNTTISATSGTATIRFIGGATGNIITNSTILGSGTMSVATNGANIFFSTDAVTTNGNDNNTISNNNIGPAGGNLATKGILCNGSTTTTAIGNSGNIIDNNNIFDYFGVAVTSAGVAVNGGCNTMSVTNNRFYQTGTRTWTTGAEHNAILMNSTTATSGVQGMTITGNTIGYASNTQTGVYTLTGSTGIFRGIRFNGITGGAVSNINNNTIASVSLTGVTSGGTSTSSPFLGILVTNGLAITNNNTIGSQSATGSLTFSTTTTSSTDVYGLYNFSVDNWTANNNNVGGISVTNAGASGTFLVFGFRANTSTSVAANLTGNNIGGTVANSISLNATGTSSQVVGFQSSNAQANLTSNVIRNMTTNIGTGTTTAASIIGINITTTTPSHTLSQNTIFNLSNSNTTAASVVTGIQFTGAATNVVERNFIHSLSAATNSATAEVNGIRVAGGTTTYRNNMIAIGAGIANAIGAAASNGGTTGVNGINEALGTDNFYHNSVYIGGTATAGSGASFAFNGSQTTNVRAFRDNIFFNARTNSGATGTNYAIKINGTTANPTGLTLNNNLYFANGTGGVFGFFNSLDVANLAAWRTAVGQDNGSFESNPQYIDPTNTTPDLHLNPMTATVAEGNGADVGVTNDFDGQTRASLTPTDIGADAGNFMGVDLSAPQINYVAFANTASTTNRILTAGITDVTGVASGGNSPRVYFKKSTDGAYVSTQCAMTGGTPQMGTYDCTINYALVGGGSVAVGDTIQYFVVAQDTLGNVGANPSGGFSATSVNMVTTPPTVPNSYNIVTAISGSVNIGTGQTYTSLTNAGGIFEFINNNEVTGNLTLNITSDLSGELGTNALNENAGGYSVTIKPVGGSWTITGTSTTNVIRINGADNVTIDGSLSGGSGTGIGGTASLRNLTIVNTSTTATAGAVVAITQGTNGANNNIIKNLIISGQDPTQTLIGLHIGSNTIGAAPAGVSNNNVLVDNCAFKRSFIGVFNDGASAAIPATGNVVSHNDLTATGADRLRRAGLFLFNHNGIQVTENAIAGITADESADAVGIIAGVQAISTTATTSGGISNSIIAKNRITGVTSTNTTGFSAVGIAIAGDPAGQNFIGNNMISGVSAPSTSPDFVAGIFVAGVAGSNTHLFYNSIGLSGDRGAVASQIGSYGVAISGTNPVVELKDNIFYNAQIATGGGANAKSYAIGMTSTTFSNLSSNYNDFFTTGVNAAGFRTGSLDSTGTDLANLAAWQGATGQDSNSLSVDPLFVNTATDLHLMTPSPVENAGVTIGSINDDIDGNPRGNPPEIGADEILAAAPGTLAFSSATYSVGEAGPQVTLTVNRTGGSDGSVQVDYALSGGTATGGGACGGSVDYVNIGTSLVFANGETTKTFNVDICNDAVFEGNETFNATLSNATGGATIGSPNPATVTITDNETQPTVQFSSATYSTTESFVGESQQGSGATISVTLSGASQSTVMVNYATGMGTATGGASCTPGVDYINASGTLTFNPGETLKGFSVITCPDTVDEPDETIGLSLSMPVNTTLGTPNTAVLTLLDNDAANGSLQFSLANFSQGEGGGTATIFVTRTGGTNGIVTADYATVAGGTATGGASCGGSVDYQNTSGTVTFPNGSSTSQSFTITLCDDATAEGDETVNLTLSNPTGGATIGMPGTSVLTIIDNDAPASPVTVTATAGTTGPTAYNTVKDAIDAINAGTHQGAVTVAVNANTTETATSVLNSSGAGSASYTSVLIRPSADGVTVAGASVQGRGLIELNGADNVTIDGDNPNTAGVNRNLTIQNTAANSVTFTSVIRIAVAATLVTTADNDAIKNLNLVGSSTGRNIAAATSTTASENTTFGVFFGPGASTTDATAAPAAVTSVATGVAAGATANNLLVSNNNVRTAARAISINGSATTILPGLQIMSNVIGNPVAGDPDQVTAIGITAQGSTNAVIASNTVWVEGYVASSAAGHAINVGVNSANVSGALIANNSVNRVRNNNPTTWTAAGINLGGGSNHIVQNNFVSGVINDQTAGTGGFGSTFGSYGIRIVSGTGHKIYHNSVHLYGAMPGVTSTNATVGLVISATTLTGIDVRNNIFSNQITGGNPAGTRHFAVMLPASATATMNLTINNNAYYVSSDPLARLANASTSLNAAAEYLVENFDPTQTTPSTNWRAYTSPLSAAGTNDNASFATATAPPFVSNVDLHIPNGTSTRLESGGAAVGVMTDIDNDGRNAMTPDIGADEFMGVGAPPNDMAAVAFVVPANGSTIPSGAITPQARFNNAGTATQTNVTVRFKIIDSMMVTIYNQTATIPTIAPLQNVVVSFPMTTIAPGSYTMQASVELAGDTNPANDTINGMFNAVAPIGGTISVGSGQTYTSLTNPGGLFQALNTAGISGNVTVNITSDLTGETGAVALNQLAESGAGGYTVTFQPAGAPRTISGTSAATNGLIVLNGADRIVFDGSLSGGTDRSLTITNNQATTGVVIWIRSPNASNGATNNTIKNCILNGAPGPNSTTVAGILTGSGTTLGNDAEAPNSNNTIQNNWIYRVQNSMYLRGGATAPVFDQNWTVVDNELGSTVAADKNIFRGMLIGNSANFTIARNTVHGIQSTTTTAAAMSGIQLALLLSNGTVTANQISDIKNVSATGTGAAGISIIATSTASNVTIANNFVSDVAGQGSATVASNGHGIAFLSTAAGSGFNLYFNSVNMTTNQASAQTSAAMFVTSTFNGVGAINARNNIFANSQTTGARYGVYSLAPATVFSAIDYNDYFAQNVGFIGGSARVTLADWQTATGQDANSKAVDPLFVSATNLHLQNGSPMLAMAIAGTGITTDIDGQTRDGMPDIGADEIQAGAMPGALQFSSATYSVGEAGGTATITVNRVGGSDGTVTVQYASSNGTATGGGACGGAVDYVDASGTLTFLGGETSKTFNVTICNDATVESNETVNLALSMPTGGATIGSPSSAVLTIVDDDVPAGTFSISDVRLFEGNAGSVNAVFAVTYAGPSTPVSVQFATANGTATAGADYVMNSGTLNFNAPGSQNVTVIVGGDVLKEENETFFVNLSNPMNATISDGQGVGIIVDEDRPYVSDFDRDLRADLTVYRPSNQTWYSLQSSNGVPKISPFTGGTPVPGDYDGDGNADFAIFRGSDGAWVILRSSDSVVVTINWGISGDTQTQGDYDGDGKTDLAVFRPSTGSWWIVRSTNGTNYTIPFGISTDRPVQGDYDGDFKTDLAVYRDGTWYILRSSNGSVQISNWGLAADRPVSGDFDGDGRYDLAVYRNGVWWVVNSLTGSTVALPWGTSTDIPVPADYDGDGTTDRAVFRPSTGDWYILRSSDSTSFGAHWGVSGDVPAPAAYIP